MIFNFYISVRKENAGRKWYQGVIHNCDGFNFHEMMKYCETFFTFFDIYEVIRFNLVLGHLCERIKELYMSGKTC